MEKSEQARLVSSDVDGTILNPSGELSPVNYVAAGRLQQAGIKLSLVSARPSFGMSWLLHMLNVECACAGLNGAILFYPGGDVFAELALGHGIAREIATIAGKRGLDVWAYTRERWFVPRINGPQVRQNTESLRTEPGRYVSLDEITDPILKLVGTSQNPEDLARLGTVLRGEFPELIAVSSSPPHYLDITRLEADKGRAATEIARREGVRLGAVLAIGDSFSDIPMFREVGHSVAMGQADVEVKSAASRLTRTNSENGFAWAVEYAIGRPKFTSPVVGGERKV